MMKNKIFSSVMLLGLVLGLAGCSQEQELLFDDTAAERLNAASDLYSARLMAQPNGWAMQLYPTNKNKAPYGSGYLVLLDFDADHSVKASMNNELTNDKYMEHRSAWQVITDNGPVLSFNTHNEVINIFSDPEDVPSTGSREEPNDETGTGIGGDFEFVIVDAPEDASYMMLKGKKRGTYNLLTPIEQGVDYEAYLEDVKGFQNSMFSPSSPSFAVIHYGDSICKFEDASDGIPTIYPYDGDVVTQSTFNPFLITKRGGDYYLRFRDKKTFGTTTVQDYKYDTAQDMFISVDNAAFYLDGDNPARFLTETLSNDGNTWMIKSGDEMSDSFQQLYTSVQEGFSAVKYTLQNISLRTNTGRLMVRVSYKAGKTNSTVDYLYSAEQKGDDITLAYQGADKAAGENILEKMPALKTMIETLSQTFTAQAATTKFNLSTIRLTSTQDKEMWFVVSKN